MQIPKTFELAGLKITVEHDNDAIKKHSFIGKSDFSFQKIVMDMTTVPRQTTEQAFLHELVHWILYIQGEHELRMNEKFVDQFAHLLYQALESGEMLKETEVDHERYLCPDCVAVHLGKTSLLDAVYRKGLQIGRYGRDQENESQTGSGCEEDPKYVLTSNKRTSHTGHAGVIGDETAREADGGVQRDYATSGNCPDECPQPRCESCGRSGE